MNLFSGKKILIISPEPWGTSMLSKHYYALQLAKNGNEVWFLQPRQLLASSGIKNLHLITDTFYIPGQHYLPSFLQRMLHRISIRFLKKQTSCHFDIVWSFDDSRWFHYDIFHAPITIYHAVDEHAISTHGRGAKSANFAIGLTQRIVEHLKKFNTRTLHIPHGYYPFEAEHESLPRVAEKIKAAYCGNLLLPFIHWPSILDCIRQSPDVHFFFIGSTGHGNLNPSNPFIPSALQELKHFPNVTLLGEKTPPILHALLCQMDLLFYALDLPEGKKVENTHKLTNYLATGKAIIGTPLSEVSLEPPLLITTDTTAFVSTFRSLIHRLDELNSQDVAEKRKDYLKKNNYSNLLLTISDWISLSQQK